MAVQYTPELMDYYRGEDDGIAAAKDSTLPQKPNQDESLDYKDGWDDGYRCKEKASEASKESVK